ncbi:hypothetical protein TKK_0010385 [Trichogramma kaykai]|uniref:C2 domain-containing protein n=1 Tax=Trichogramma kaykai TaxID=54128 RepID=A0ABD2WXF5_9HYME
MGAYNFFGPDLRAPEIMAILGCVGATAGAVSAIIVYAICSRKRRVLNWFEKDLLDQSEEAEKSSKKNANIQIQMGKSCEKDNQCVAGILANKIMKTHQINHRQSESIDEERAAVSASTSLIAPAPLPTGDVVLVGSDQRMVLVKGLSVSSRSSSYADSEDNDADATITSRGPGSSSTESESCCSDDLSCPRSPLETCGKIDMHVAYDKIEDALRIKISKVYDLIETTNPYVKIRLIPDRNCVKKTKIIKQTLKPGNYFTIFL